MSTDYELLVLAAKAAGIQYNPDVSKPKEGRVWWGLWLVYKQEPSEYDRRYWQPHKDDGDALRLAVDLRLQVLPGKHPGDGCTVDTQRPGIAGCTAFRDDKREQTRRAIVIAAAEIGRSLAGQEQGQEGESRERASDA